MIDLQTTAKPIAQAYADIAAEHLAHGPVIDAFHRVFYASPHTHGFTFFEGVPVLKSPLDLWVVQEIVWDLRPTLIIETGTAYGGSALFLARQLDKLHAGHVVTVDLAAAEVLPEHARITYLQGSSTDVDMLDAIAGMAARHARVMVLLDSDHAAEHVLAELSSYAPLVTAGQFLVVEDTNLNGRPVEIDWKGGPGPGVAVSAWLPDHAEFERDVLAERYMVTFHSWLRRVQ
jgi:cephalosporin hydroxylase